MILDSRQHRSDRNRDPLMSSRKLDEELQAEPDRDSSEKLDELKKTLEDASETLDELHDEDE